MPTEDYIKKSDAVFAVQKRIEQIGMENNPYVCSIRQAVRDAPAADVEPVRHGRWIPHETNDGFSNGVQCSVCGEWFYKYFTYNYCPDCGAKMDEEEDHADTKI